VRPSQADVHLAVDCAETDSIEVSAGALQMRTIQHIEQHCCAISSGCCRFWEHGGTTWTPGAPPPPAHPTNPPTPTPVPVASVVDALADSLIARNAAVATLGVAVAREIARRCLNLTGDAGISGDPCKTLPIFMPGANHAAATNHRITAIASYLPWVR
jgi:hypothetical protein